MRSSLWLAAVLGLVVATAAPAPAADPGARQRPTVAVRPAKAEFVAGEPIGIEVTIANPGPLPVEFWLGDPPASDGVLSPIQFDGGRAAPPRPWHGETFSGPFLSVTTTVAPGKRWPITVFLQNFLQQTPPGEHRIGYRFAAGYFLGERPEGDAFDRLLATRLDGKPENDGPSLDAEGSLTIRIAPRDPAALDRIFQGYVEELRRAGRDEAPEPRPANILDAFRAVDDPAVIPYLAALVRPADRPDDPAVPLADPVPILRTLERFRDREAARRVVIDQLSSADRSVVSHALEWLREGSVPIRSETLEALLDGANARGESPYSILWYLQEVPAGLTPALRERLTRCLQARRPSDVARALWILARGKAPREPAIRKALETLSGSLDGPNPLDLALVVDALGAWRYPLALERLRALMRKKPGMPDPPYRSILQYLEAVRVPDFRALEPQVAALLIGQAEEVRLSALRVLAPWGHALSPKEAESLLREPGALRDATIRYLGRQRSH